MSEAKAVIREQIRYLVDELAAERATIKKLALAEELGRLLEQKEKAQRKNVA
jgi:hypothetical protein